MKKEKYYLIVSVNRKSWKTVKPLFSNKGDYGNKIKLVENEKSFDDGNKVAEKQFFKILVAFLGIHRYQYTVENVEDISDPVDKAIKKLNFIRAFYLSKIEFVKTFLKIDFALMK